MIYIDETDIDTELPFPYKDVKIRRDTKIRDQYEMETEIGRGKFGTVYRCREHETGLVLAAKFINTMRRDDRRCVEREVDIMNCLKHPRLLQLYDAVQDDARKEMVLVLELIQGGELFERVIDDDFVLTEKACAIFMKQICEGVEYIHTKNILHLDLKPENILCLTRTGNRIKIIDFGLARKFDPSKNLQVLFGTPEFVAPEVVNFDRIGFGTDMWSLGVMCYVLLSGLSPFMGETDVETMANVTIAKYDFDDEAFEEISQDAKDFITRLLLKDKDKRLTATECLQHQWLRKKVEPPKKQTKNENQQDQKLTQKLIKKEELDMTKDNLRTFVDRWNEHPNSPYVFDSPCRIISVCSINNLRHISSQHSLLAMSPSPCGSLNSSPDSVLDYDILSQSPDEAFMNYTFDRGGGYGPSTDLRNKQFGSYNFERRASDSTYLIKNSVNTADLYRANLADEIRELSEKLSKIASQSTTDISNNNDSRKCSKEDLTMQSEQSMEKTFRSEKVIQINDNGQRGNKSCSDDEATPLVENGQFKFPAINGRHHSRIQREMHTLPTLSETVLDDRSISPRISHASTKSVSSSSSSSSSALTVSQSSSLNPISPSRTPLRRPPSCLSISMSAPNSPVHSPRSSPERETKDDLPTKDLLLHLLNKWDSKPSTASNGPVLTVESCRKAISMEWTEVETMMKSFRERTMKSFGSFYESSTSSATTTTTTSSTATTEKRQTINFAA